MGVVEDGITSIGDEVFVVPKKKSAQATLQKKEEVFTMNIVCRKCGKVGDHWTSKCPYKDRSDADAATAAGTATASTSSAAPAAAAGAEGSSGRYVPPTLRGLKPGERGAASGGGGMGSRSDDANTIRITNLSEETKESDLRELLAKFGPVARCFIPKS